ncbi:hypothetical protein HOY80DRAFT_1009950 [Tuber brumale]|nr:hypothetical protein HOY80DRAFT_1009950 [Tuber brumale]
MASFPVTFSLGVFPLLAQAGPNCPPFVIGATPDKVFGATGDFFNAKFSQLAVISGQGVPLVTSSNPSGRTLALDSVQFVEELMSANVDRTNKVNCFSINWKTADSVTFATAAVQVRISYYEQNFEVEPRCNGSTHSTGNWRTWLCVSGDSSKDAAMEWFEAKHRNAVQNVIRGLGVQGWMEEQINGEIPGCGAVITTNTPPSTASASASTPTTAPAPVPQAAPGQMTITPRKKTAGGHRDKAGVMFASAIGGIIVPAFLRL